MPIERAVVEEFVAKVNATRPKGLEARLESYEAPGAFVLSFPNRAMPDGQCIDQDFSAIQWALHEEKKIDTNLVAGRLKPEDDRYYMRYHVVEWD